MSLEEMEDCEIAELIADLLRVSAHIVEAREQIEGDGHPDAFSGEP
jgi:hypothetical protein